MLHCIARLLEPLMRLLWPPLGRHRAQVAYPAPASAGLPPMPSPAPAVRRPPEPFFRGEDCPLVRPYLVDHERRRAEARRQRARRRALWLAVHGIDIGPRLIHGMEVTA